MVLLQGIIIGRALIESLRTRTQQQASRSSRQFGRCATLRRSPRPLAARRAAAANPNSYENVRLRLGGNCLRSSLDGCRGASTAAATAEREVARLTADDFVGEQWTAVYRFTLMPHAAAISRVKLAQTLGTVCLVPLLSWAHSHGYVSLVDCYASAGLAVFACAMLYVMSFYLRRLVGVVAITADEQFVRLGYLDFWGRRRDAFAAVDDLVPLAEAADGVRGVYYAPVRRYSTADLLYMPLQAVQVVDAARFERVFGATPLTRPNKPSA